MSTVKPVYIAVAVCNFDDVILGGYTTKAAAVRRARQCVRDPMMRHKGAVQASHSEYIRAMVVAAVGARRSIEWSHDHDDGMAAEVGA